MEKRLFVAILISFLILLGWSRLAPVLFPELAKRPVTAQTPANPTDGSRTVAKEPAAPVAPAPAVAGVVAAGNVPVESRQFSVVVERPDYRAEFSNRGAQLTSFVLKNYKEPSGAPVDLVKKRPANRLDYPFALLSPDHRWNDVVNSRLYSVQRSTKSGTETIRFTAPDPTGQAVTKTFTFDNSYYFSFAVDCANRAVPYRVEIGPGIRSTDPAEKESQFTTTGNALVERGGSLERMRREKTSGFHPLGAPVSFVGLDDNYFLAAIKPERAGDAIVRVAMLPSSVKGEKERGELFAGVNSAGGSIAGHAYFGPKETDLLDRFGFHSVVQFGYFGFIARFLLKALVYVYSFTHNFGWAIVALTVIIKLLLYPLQHKSIVSMKKMQKVQPKVNAIKEKYRKAKTDPDQRQKMNLEMMKLYQTEGISPVSGCLPILLQLPILWAFYGLLSNAIELRGAGWFGWIHDLSAKDPYYITPLLMMATMFIQQWITPSTVDPVQKKMFMIMPLIFGFIFKEFPSGLVLYWLVQNVLTIAQQMIMNRYWKDHPESLKKA